MTEERKRLTPTERKEVVSRIANAAEENQRAEARKELAQRITKAVYEAVLKMPSQHWDLVVGFGGSFDVDVPKGPDERGLALKVKASRIASMAEISAARGLASSSDSNTKTDAERVADMQERIVAANARQATMYP